MRLGNGRNYIQTVTEKAHFNQIKMREILLLLVLLGVHAQTRDHLVEAVTTPVTKISTTKPPPTKPTTKTTVKPTTEVTVTSGNTTVLSTTNTTHLSKNDTTLASSGILYYLDNGVLYRMLYVVVGLSGIVAIYFIVRAVKTRRRKSKSKKYGVIDGSVDMELQPLDNDEDEEDMTLFDVSKNRKGRHK